MQPDAEKVLQKLVIANANATLETAKLSALVEQQQEEIEQLRQQLETKKVEEN